MSSYDSWSVSLSTFGALSPASTMRVQGWNCMLGLLCMPAGVILNEWTASQHPSSTSFVRINSSTEISCSTSMSDPLSLSLKSQFKTKADVVYLSLDKGAIGKTTTAMAFTGRIHVSVGPRVKEGYSFTLRLSMLRVEDTDLYYCSWSYFDENKKGNLHNNGTVIIVGETSSEETCKSTAMDLTKICLIIAVVLVIAMLGIGALIFKCMRFKKIFVPGGDVQQPTASRHRLVAPERPVQHCPYLITSVEPSWPQGLPMMSLQSL